MEGRVSEVGPSLLSQRKTAVGGAASESRVDGDERVTSRRNSESLS